MPLKKTIRLGIGARNSKQNQQAHENDDNAESSFSKQLERGEVSPQQQLPFDDDPELDTIRTLMPITLLCIYASFGIPNQGEIDWQTRTELSAGAHGRISIEIFQKSYLSTYLVNGSGRTSRYDGSQEIVVVKNTITDFAEDPTTPSRDTLAEILYMGASHVLRHENIIDLLGIFWEPDSTGQIIPTLVLEFAPHGSLKDLFLTEPKMTFPEKLAISADICKALQSLHHEAKMWGFPIGLFHGDLKPENIMMFPLNGKEKRYQAKLGDMGSTIIYTPGKTSSHASLGTTGWSAPELKSQSYFDPTAAESFSFGLVFCFIAFDGKAAWELGSIVNYCKANISSPSDATVIAKISALPEDVLLFLIREALQYQDNLQKSEKNLVDLVSTATIRTDPKARCTDFGKLSGMLDADPAEKRQRQPIGNLVDVYATTNSLLTEEGALEIVALASTMPYAFREMIQDRLELVFESLGLKSLYRGHIALLLGVLAFIQPRLKKRNISGQEWFKKAADLGCVTAIPLLARLLPASISGRAKVKRLLTPAVLYDSVFGREDMEESSPETYRQILTEIKKVDIWIGCCRFFNSKDKIISDLLQLTPAGSTGVPDRSGKLSDLLDQISGSVPAQKIRELQVAQFGESLTHYAAGCNDIKLLTTLRKLHAFNSAPTMRGETPAHFACRSGHLEALKLTIEETKGIQLAPDLGGATPLHYLFRFQTEEECNEVAVKKVKRKSHQ